MAEENWEQAAESADLQEDHPVQVRVGKRAVLLTRMGGRPVGRPHPAAGWIRREGRNGDQ
jgi:hypothetical protein